MLVPSPRLARLRRASAIVRSPLLVATGVDGCRNEVPERQDVRHGFSLRYKRQFRQRRLQMLFSLVYTARDVTEESQKRSLNLFTNWKPPAGYEFKAHSPLADGTG